MMLGKSLSAVLFMLVALGSSFALADDLASFSTLSGKIDIAGGTAHIPVMTEAAKRIMAKNAEIRITVAGGGSGVGVQKVGEGLVDIGNTGRPLSTDEETKYGLTSFPFAIDGVAAVVHPKNPVDNLTALQIQKIFAGEIKNWKDVGGLDSPIHVYTRDEASGTREVFWEKLLNKGSILDAAHVIPSNGAMKVAIAQDSTAIGYVSIGHIDNSVKAPKLGGTLPSQENAMSGSYPVTRKLYMNTKGKPSVLVQSFIDYILGESGAEIIKKSGYLPL